MTVQTGTFTGTGASGSVAPQSGDFSYRLNCSAYTSGTATWTLGRTNDGNVRFQLTGTWVGTVDLQSNDGSGWVDTG